MIILGAFIRIPVPVVPFTMQFLFVLLAGLLLPKKLSVASVLIYIFMGLIGFPVFAQGGGFSYVLMPSFGYIIGFAAGAYAIGFILEKSEKPSYPRLLFASFAGLIIVYLFGMVYYYLISNFYLGTPIGVWPLFLYCFILAVPGDIAICLAGSSMAKRMIPIIKKGTVE